MMNSNPVFNSSQIVETAKNSLAARAVLKLGTICELGTVWISDPECIRWNAESGRGEVCLGEWRLIMQRYQYDLQSLFETRDATANTIYILEKYRSEVSETQIAYLASLYESMARINRLIEEQTSQLIMF